MASSQSSITLSGVTLPQEKMPFLAQATVGETDSKGVTEYSTPEYMFYMSEKYLGFRKKAKSSGALSPMKEITSFEQLKQIGFAIDTIEVESQKEKITMALTINAEGKAITVPADVEKIIRDAGKITGNKIELDEFDTILDGLKGDNAKKAQAFAEEINKQLPTGGDAGAAPATTKPAAGTTASKAADAAASAATAAQAAADSAKEDASVAADAAASAGATPAAGAPAAGATGIPTTPGGITGSSIFSSQNAAPKTERRVKTQAERDADAAKRQQQQLNDQMGLKEATGSIEKLHELISEKELAEKAIEDLTKLVAKDGVIPIFKTLVETDTRIKASVVNKVKAQDRVYHPAVASNPANTKTGKDIPVKLSKGEFEVNLVETTPSQPKGYFVLMPEALKDFTPSKISQLSERKKIVTASEVANDKRTIVYYSRPEFLQLLILTGMHGAFFTQLGVAVPNSPMIVLKQNMKAESGEIVYSLKAVSDAGKNIKLSVRHFVPLSTFVTTSKSDPKFNAQILSDLLFHRLLVSVPDGYAANRLSQLTPASVAKFEQRPDGTILFQEFQDKMTVPAYDSTKDLPMTKTLDLPLAVMSSPTTATAVAKPTFVKVKHNEPGYKAQFTNDLHAVRDAIKTIKKVTTRNQLNETNQERGRLDAVARMLSADSIAIK